MIDFIDKSSENSGTPLNRKNMMALQGFYGKRISFNKDGSITVENEDDKHTTVVTFNEDGSITETFYGEKTITKTTTFLSDGSIQEVIS